MLTSVHLTTLKRDVLQWKCGRVVYCAGLESRRSGKLGPWVQIPPLPQPGYTDWVGQSRDLNMRVCWLN